MQRNIQQTINRVTKQRNLGNVIGYILQVMMQMTVPMGIINMILLIITTSTALQQKGYLIPMWLLGLVVISVLVLAGLLVFRLVLPSFFSAWNDQFWQHNNPIRDEFLNINKRLSSIEEKIEGSNGHKTLRSEEAKYLTTNKP